MNEMKNLNEIADKVKDVEEGVNNLIVPILKDTIADSNRHNKRLFVLTLILSISLLVVTICSQYFIMKQNEKYAEFLSQFEFEGEAVYQDLDTGDNSDIINPIINNGK